MKVALDGDAMDRNGSKLQMEGRIGSVPTWLAGLGKQTRQYGENNMPWPYAKAAHPDPADTSLTRSKPTLCGVESEFLGRLS
jgi:hypothetical protein